MVLPASSVLTTSSTGLITYTLPEAAAQANAVTCTIGTCHYNAEQRTIRWQGPMQAGDLAFLSFELRFRQDLPPSPQPIEVKTTIDLFDGRLVYKVKGVITLNVPPPFEEREK